MAAAAMLWPALAFADKADNYYAELVEWVYAPCMEVGAAAQVGSLDQEKKDLGVKRSQVARVMLASREKAIRELAETLASGKKNPTWEQRRHFYAPFLEMCVRQQLPSMK